MQEGLKIKRLSISDFLGFEDMVIEPSGSVTVIDADNGEGKTTVVSALSTLFGGGTPTKMIRNGAERAEIGLLLDNGIEFRKTIPRGGKATLKESHPEFGNVTAAQTHLNKLTEQFSVNPAKLLTADASERVNYVLKALPLELDREKLAKVVPTGIDIPAGHPLTVLPAIEKQIRERRRTKHVQMDEKSATVNSLRKSIPEEAKTAEDIAQALLLAREELQSATNGLDAVESAARQTSADRIAKAKSDRDQFIEFGDRELQQEIDRLRNAWSEKKDAKVRECEHQIDLLTKDVHAKQEAARAEFQPQIDEFNKRIAALEQEASEEVRRQNTRDIIASTESQRIRLEREWQDLDQRVKDIESLTESLRANLPIPGLEIVDGDLAYNGIAWETLNTANQIAVVFKLAEFTAGDMGVVFFDNMECLSTKNFQLFLDEAMKSGLQVIVTRVADGPLRVTKHTAETVDEGQLALA